MAQAASPAPGVGGVGDASWLTWLRIQLARIPNAARLRATERRDDERENPPVGLLQDADLDFRAAAYQVATTAPAQFGRLDEVRLRGRFLLRGDDVRTLDELVHEAVRIAAAGFAGPEPHPAGVAALDERLKYADDFLKRREGEIARRRYARGLFRGVALTFVVIIGGLGAAVMMLWQNGSIPLDQADALRDVLVAIGAGAAGACVSVLLRMHRMQHLTIEVADSGIATYRIFLGWFFAAAIVFLLKSGLLSEAFVIPEGRIESWFFWGAVGFLAGFNERWATNLISRSTEDAGSGTALDAPTTGAAGRK
ncbi:MULTISPECIES: hypothetical protein [Microbacterium]|uniref:hypothetical protein n=1 Tax=Microbacterium TaxID=33882 RepID=UPI000D6481C7|nr:MULTISPECIES: hypothetical protein [Microbacterium]